jgi:hypothetical protein
VCLCLEHNQNIEKKKERVNEGRRNLFLHREGVEVVLRD